MVFLLFIENFFLVLLFFFFFGFSKNSIDFSYSIFEIPPASYIFLRGQGIRVNSLVTRTCSSLNTRIPDLEKSPLFKDYIKMIKNGKSEEEVKESMISNAGWRTPKEFELNHKQFGLDVIEQIKQCEKYLKKPDSLDLVLMYIASPSIYQYIIENRFYSIPSAQSPDISLQEYAEEKKVVLVSPQLLFVILEHIKIVKDNFQIIEAQEELQKAHSDFIKQWENWSMTVDKIQNSVDDIIKKINQDKDGGLNFEIRQFRVGRFNKLNEKVDVMKQLLENKKES